MTAHPFSTLETAIAPPISVSFERRARTARGSWKPFVGRHVLSLPCVVWMALDVVLVSIGTLLGQQMFVSWSAPASLLGDANPLVANIVLASSVILAGLMFGLYEQQTLWSRSRAIARALLTISVAMLATLLVLHLLIYSTLSRRAAATGVVFYLVTGPVLRVLAHSVVTHVRRGLLIIGHGPLMPGIIRAVRRNAVPGYHLVGIVSDGNADATRHVRGVEIIGNPDQIAELWQRHDIHEVVVSSDAARNEVYQRAAMRCLRLGCRVIDEMTFFEKSFGEVPVTHISPSWFLFADLKGQREEHATAKRIFDLVVAAVVGLLSLPLWPLLICAVRLQGRGPIFYSQARVGQGGRTFTLYKFRSMQPDAEPNGSVWARPNDPRVTRIGRILRRTRLDELPQIYNILRGDMSFVGPRPERPEFVAPLTRLIPFYNERHLIKPGLTGWAQINFRYGASIADASRKLQLDLYYIKHMSFELDLVILLRTVGKLFAGLA